jgi:hypothetical protein
MARGVLPPFFYRWVCGWNWAARARRNGMKPSDLHARPFDGEQ